MEKREIFLLVVPLGALAAVTALMIAAVVVVPVWRQMDRSTESGDRPSIETDLTSLPGKWTSITSNIGRIKVVDHQGLVHGAVFATGEDAVKYARYCEAELERRTVEEWPAPVQVKD